MACTTGSFLTPWVKRCSTSPTSRNISCGFSTAATRISTTMARSMPSPGFSPAIWIRALSWMTARQTQTTDRTDLFGGIALGIAALAAVGIANSALGDYYDALIHVTAEIRIGSFGLSKSLDHWI